MTTKIAISSDEPTVSVTIVMPARLLPKLMAVIAVACTPAAKPCVETTAEEAPATRPGIVRARPASCVVPFRPRRVGLMRTVQFTYMLERDPAFWALPVPVELRAEVELGDGYNDEPTVTPLEVAVWQDALGPEVVLGVESALWIGAKEAAVDAAVEQVSRQATAESNAMSEAS